MHHNTIRVALVEPQALVQEALRALLDGDPALTVVAAVSNAAEMLPILQSSSVDVVLLTLEPDRNNHDEAEVGDFVNRLLRQCRALVLARHATPSFQRRLIELCARGVVLINQTGEVLSNAIKSVHAGELWFDRSTLTAAVTRLTRRGRNDGDLETAKVESLTTREREVIALVADGFTNPQISERLCISPVTVRNHLTSILSKLDLADRFQLAVYAFRRGLVLCPATEDMRRMSATMQNRPVRGNRRF